MVTQPLPWAASSNAWQPFSVKKFFLISNLNLPWCNLRLFPLVLSLVPPEKRLTPTSLQPPFRQLTASCLLVLSLLFHTLDARLSQVLLWVRQTFKVQINSPTITFVFSSELMKELAMYSGRCVWISTLIIIGSQDDSGYYVWCCKMALLAPKAFCTQSGMETSLQRCYSAHDGPGQMPPNSCSTALGSKRAGQETELSLCWSQFLTKNQLTAKTL